MKVVTKVEDFYGKISKNKILNKVLQKLVCLRHFNQFFQKFQKISRMIVQVYKKNLKNNY